MKNQDIFTNPPLETIRGQIVSKANNYQAVPGKFGNTRIIKNAKIRDYERLFLSQCNVYRGAGINTPFELVVSVYSSNDKFDIDNALKTLLDCLQYAGAITDDNLCIRIVADKLIDVYDPRVVYQIIAERPAPTLFDFI